MICEFFCLNTDFATKAQVNMVSLDLSMAAAQRPHTKGSIGLAYSLLPSRKRVNSKSRAIAASTLVRRHDGADRVFPSQFLSPRSRFENFIQQWLGFRRNCVNDLLFQFQTLKSGASL